MNPTYPLFPAASRFNGRRIGLLGGSFNPAHDGHAEISTIALRKLALDEVWWLISPQNPLKPTSGMAALDARVERARMIADHPAIRVLDIRSRLATRYTIDTIRTFQHLSNAHFVWLMGADNLAQLPEWKSWWTLAQTIPIAIMDRPGYSYCGLAGQGAQRLRKYRVPERASRTLAGSKAPAWVFLHCARNPASATRLRAQKLSEAGGSATSNEE